MRLLLHNCCYYVTLYVITSGTFRISLLRVIIERIFRSDLIFGRFWAWFLLQITFRVRVYVFVLVLVGPYTTLACYMLEICT